MPHLTNRQARGLEEELRALEQSAKSLNISAMKVHEHLAATVTSSTADPAVVWLAFAFRPNQSKTLDNLACMYRTLTVASCVDC